MIDDAGRAADDLDSVKTLVEDAERSLVDYADMYYNVRSLWDDVVMTDFNRRPGETADKVVPPGQKARFIAAIDECRSQLHPGDDFALTSVLSPMRVPLTWAELSTATSLLLCLLKRVTRDALVRSRAAMSRRAILSLRRDELRSEARAVEIAWRGAEMQHLRARGHAELLPARPLPAERPPSAPLPAALPAAGRPAGPVAWRSCPPIRQGRQGAPPGPAYTNPWALGRLRRAALQAAEQLIREEDDLELDLHQAESDHQDACRFYAAHSDFHSDLMILLHSFEYEGPLPELVPAGLRDKFAAVFIKNSALLIRDVGQTWSDSMSACAEAYKTPIAYGALVPEVRQWLAVLSRQTGYDLWHRGQAEIRGDALRVRLAQARSDSSAARLAVLAFDVLSRRRPGEHLPTEPLPAERLLAPLSAESPPAEALPAAPLQAGLSPAGPRVRRPRVRQPGTWPWRGSGGAPVVPRRDVEGWAGLADTVTFENSMPTDSPSDPWRLLAGNAAESVERLLRAMQH